MPVTPIGAKGQGAIVETPAHTDAITLQEPHAASVSGPENREITVFVLAPGIFDQIAQVDLAIIGKIKGNAARKMKQTVGGKMF